jgi:hypothetical protein
MRYWQPSLVKTTAKYTLQHPENERQQSITTFRNCIFHNQGIARILARIAVLLTALLAKNTLY